MGSEQRTLHTLTLSDQPEPDLEPPKPRTTTATIKRMKTTDSAEALMAVSHVLGIESGVFTRDPLLPATQDDSGDNQ
jgi:hypothetical protein